MVTQPDDFDCRSAAQVLRLRLRDWMWPSAIAVATVIPFLGQHSGTYRIGSVTYYANTLGPPLFVGLLAFAGIRWCWIGRPGTRAACPGGQCGHRGTGPDPSDAAVRGPHGVADDPAERPRGRLPIARILLDLPGLLLTGFAVWVVALVVLGSLGLIDLD